MSDPSDTPIPPRDNSGRFVSQKSSHRPDDKSEWNPLARTLFGWVTGRRVGLLFFWGALALAALLFALELVIHLHPKFEAERLFGFYGIWGFVSFAFVVLMGWPLGRLLRRDENYYGDQDETPDAPRGPVEDEH